MGRRKKISDDDVLGVARAVFRTHGHDATTRAIAQAAGISEAVLYQRFGSKNDLFFAAMRPIGPDVAALLGPDELPRDARKYLGDVVVRIGQHFAEVIPLALRLMTHPDFHGGHFTPAQPRAPAALHEAFATRLALLARRGLIQLSSPPVGARLLISLAHDWALGLAMQQEGYAPNIHDLRQRFEVAWDGLSPTKG